MVNERDIIELAADKLRQYGNVEIESITDQLNPYGGTNVPDLVFTPESGPNSHVIHIIEFKTTNAEILPDVLVSNALRYKRSLEEANPGMTLRYALGSNGRVIMEGPEPEIAPLETIHDANELVERIVEWSGVTTEALAGAGAMQS